MSAPTIRTLRWSEIDLAPEGPGVYAWYARMTMSSADVNDIIERIKLAANNDAREARTVIEDGLERFIFAPFRETPYQVSVSGPLKPKFKGEVAHEATKSESLIDRLVLEPERLRTIAEILHIAAPAFTAPLYIGMSKHLRSRLRSHRGKIIDFGEMSELAASDDSYDSGFARQVVARNIDPTNLFVHVAEVSVGRNEKEYADIENILNRINFPIFGRN